MRTAAILLAAILSLLIVVLSAVYVLGYEMRTFKCAVKVYMNYASYNDTAYLKLALPRFQPTSRPISGTLNWRAMATDLSAQRTGDELKFDNGRNVRGTFNMLSGAISATIMNGTDKEFFQGDCLPHTPVAL